MKSRGDNLIRDTRRLRVLDEMLLREEADYGDDAVDWVIEQLNQ